MNGALKEAVARERVQDFLREAQEQRLGRPPIKKESLLRRTSDQLATRLRRRVLRAPDGCLEDVLGR